MTVPNSTAFYQNAKDGSAIAGIYMFVTAFSGLNYREYIETKLISTLIPSKQYCVRFYVSLVDSAQYAVSTLSAYFSENGGSRTSPIPYFNYTPQISSTQLLSDKSNWMKIEGVFTAQGNERYITIGNFRPDSLIDTTYVGGSSTDLVTYDWRVSYYLIDDISVTAIEDIVASYSDTICSGDSVRIGLPTISDVTYNWQPSTGLSNPTIAQPNSSPASTTTYTLTQTQCDVVQTSEITVIVKTNCPDSVPQFPTILIGDELLYAKDLLEGTGLQIFDALGKSVYYSNNYQNDFCACLLAQGTYILRIKLPSGRLVQRKLVVAR